MRLAECDSSSVKQVASRSNAPRSVATRDGQFNFDPGSGLAPDCLPGRGPFFILYPICRHCEIFNWQYTCVLTASELSSGFYAMDIATLQKDHPIEDGKYIARYRNKTGIPTKHLLWPVSRKRIHRCRARSGDLLFTRKQQLPLVVEKSNDGKRYDSIAGRRKRVSDQSQHQGDTDSQSG